MSSTNMTEPCDRCGKESIQTTIAGNKKKYFCGTWECIQAEYPEDKYPMVNKFMNTVKCRHEEMLDQIQSIIDQHTYDEVSMDEIEWIMYDYKIPSCKFCGESLIMGINKIVGCSNIGCKFNAEKEEE